MIFSFFPEAKEKFKFFDEIKSNIIDLGFNICSEDFHRPWGGFLVIDPDQIEAFSKQFFSELDLDLDSSLSYSPKILLVAPNQKLSWQYHHRRSELWKLVAGKAAISRSFTNQENPATDMEIGDLIKLAQGERHRLIGKDTWGIVAEIWVHTDPTNPSDESDIVRIQDDYQRK
ncbi:cupin domain-containing protein [Belliella pelovolcani]|uniref:Mannose-6-phosphate isomerase, type 2 n=1 Tax=Belliella pelovolcani TaxID=529505 RepID=A0A1N7ME48_9BACT|nr:phosphoheptose isomerase [Belliella pelovolcani]SIS84318.1 mannose-6-phosphate isomerase, type 2 [Belliella pelovolcani]